MRLQPRIYKKRSICKQTERSFYAFFHDNSWSSLENRSDEKKSRTEISSPSHIFLMVATVVLLFLPETMLLSVDCVIPLNVESLLTVIFRSLQSSRIRIFTASPICKFISSNQIELTLEYNKYFSYVTPKELTFVNNTV